jgi:hypothetical protein
MPQQISWYLYFTREHSLAFKETLADNRMHTIKSEDSFKGELNQFNILKLLFPLTILLMMDLLLHLQNPSIKKRKAANNK